MSRTAALLAALTLAAPGVARADDPAPPKPAAPTPGTTAAPAAPPASAASPAAAPTQQTPDLMIAEVITLPYGKTASYGPVAVRGPQVNLTDGGNGEWKGNIRDLSGVYTVTEKRISGANLNMVMDRDGEEWTCQGTVDGKRVRIVWGSDGLTARYDNRFYDMKRVAADLWASVPTGPGLRVKGDAAERNPLYPQFIFALLSVL